MTTSAPIFYNSTIGTTSTLIGATAYGGSRTTPASTLPTDIFTGSSTAGQDTLIRNIRLAAVGTTANATLDFWLYDGTTYRLLPFMRYVSAITASTTQAPWSATITPPEGLGTLIIPGAATPWRISAGLSVTASGGGVWAAVEWSR